MFSNATAEEEFKLTGTLRSSSIESLLDGAAALESYEGIEAHISEAMGQYPAEDFTSELAQRMLNLAKRLRGDNKAEMLAIIESLDDMAQCRFNASEYGRSELQAALDVIKPPQPQQ
jgi:hypothetical protein